MSNPPIFVIVRDLLSPLQQLLDWLERAGHDRIILVDNASTYPPMLEYLCDDRPHRGAVRLEHGPPLAVAEWRCLRPCS